MKQTYIDTAALEAIATLLHIEARNICGGCKDEVVLNMNNDHGLGPAGANMGLGLSVCKAKKLRKLTKTLYGIIDEYKRANAMEHEIRNRR